MAHRLDDVWRSSPDSGVPRRDRQEGHYEQYVPDLLNGRPLRFGSALGLRVAEAERSIRALGSGPGAEALEGLSRFLLRSEALASSQIEGIAPSPQQVALAELSHDEEVRGFGEAARLVANNITVLRTSSRELADADRVSVAQVEGLQAALLPDENHHGLRTTQNWLGGSRYHPLGADFVPPPVEHVRPLMDDLLDYLNGSLHGPLVQAALVHAQFETIHPFPDGNGRVGRALIHTVLVRRGLTSAAVLPVSMVLRTLSDKYVQGLSAYRYEGAADSPEATSGTTAWLDIFAEACRVAAERAQTFVDEIADLRADWSERVAAHRSGRGVRQAPRIDSATARLLAVLPEAPLMTARSAERLLGISQTRARDGLEEMAAAGVLEKKTVERGVTGYSATEVFDLITIEERRLASTRFDTRLALPGRGVPARPQRP